MSATTDKDGTTPYLPTTTGRRLWPPSLSSTIERMLLHPIYQLLLEAGYDPQGLPTTTERMLLHHIYQLLLGGGYDPLAAI